MFKPLLNAIHDVVHNIVHIIVILPLAALKGLDTFLQRIINELSKV